MGKAADSFSRKTPQGEKVWRRGSKRVIPEKGNGAGGTRTMQNTFPSNENKLLGRTEKVLGGGGGFFFSLECDRIDS